MIALIQRVNHASVTIDGELHAQIGKGILALIGLEKNDSLAVADKLLDKLLAYRIFSDAEGRMNLSLKDIDGDLLLVSQFTLAADTGSGLRPGFSRAMAPEQAQVLYEDLVTLARNKHGSVYSGVFAADMQVALENDGPVTFQLTAT